MLTAINVPYQLADFVKHIRKHSSNPKDIDFHKGLDTMQQLSVAGGVSPASQTDLLEWFGPVLFEEDSATLDEFE